jgi:hypothetical protein
MPKRPAFPGLRAAMKKKITLHEQFLAEVDVSDPMAEETLSSQGCAPGSSTPSASSSASSAT